MPAEQDDGRPAKTALVLSAGGLFGAYQAGVWRSLAPVFRPDMVVGTSAGALNSWAIAGGASPDQVEANWLDPGLAEICRVGRRLTPWRGVFDSDALHEKIRRLWAASRPRIPVGVTTAEIPALRPRLFVGDEIGWEQLAASCAIVFGYRQIRIGKQLYTDGGLLDVLPLWAAVQMGASRIVAVNVLPRMPSAAVRFFVRCARAVAKKTGLGPREPEVHLLTPGAPLGSVHDALFWRKENVETWVAMGAEDGARFAAGLEWNESTGSRQGYGGLAEHGDLSED